MEPNKRPKFFDQLDEPKKTELDRILDDIREQVRYAMRKYPQPKKSAASDTSRPAFFAQFDEPEKSDYDRLLDEVRAQMLYAIRKHPNIRAELSDIIDEEEPNESK